MKAPTAIVAEDEAALREQLLEQLRNLWPELVVLGAAADGVEALRLLEQQRPDILFLDIQMRGLPGRRSLVRPLAAAISCSSPHSTSMRWRHSSREQSTTCSSRCCPPRLFSTVCRLKERLKSGPIESEAVEAVIGQLAMASSARPMLRWINASVGQNLRVITVDEVLYSRRTTSNACGDGPGRGADPQTAEGARR